MKAETPVDETPIEIEETQVALRESLERAHELVTEYRFMVRQHEDTAHPEAFA